MKTAAPRCGAYLLLTFTLSWALWAPLVLLGGRLPAALDFTLLLAGSLVPSTIGIILTGVEDGAQGMFHLLRRLLLWRVRPRWYAVLLIPTLLMLGAVTLNALFFNGPSVAFGVPVLTAFVMVLFSIFPGSASGEELGWRGYVLPRLQTRRGALQSSLVLGALHGLWHLPLWLRGAPSHPLSLFLPFFLQAVAMAVLYTWLYNSTEGSLLLAVLFHAATNAPLTLILVPLGPAGLTSAFWLLTALTVSAAVVVIAIFGSDHLARHSRQQHVIPAAELSRPQGSRPSL